MELYTERLILRYWKEEDAEILYRYACNPNVGPSAGWPVHTSAKDSLRVIKTILAPPENYAVVLKEENIPVGSIGFILNTGDEPQGAIGPNEGEIGYWMGEPYWGRGLMPEAVKELIRHGFEDLGLNKIWCAYYEGNLKSKRVQEKCGFTYHHLEKDKLSPMLNETRDEHFMVMTKEQYLRK